MKKLLLFLGVLFFYQISSAQTVTYSFPKIQNEYEVFLKTEENNDFVFLIKENKSGNIDEVKISKNSTASKFIDAIVSAAGTITDTYFIETAPENAYFEIPKDSITNDYVSIRDGIESETLIPLIKPNLIYLKNKRTFEDFIGEIGEDPLLLIDGSDKFQVQKVEEEYKFTKANSELFEVTDEETFLDLLTEKYKEEIIDFILPEEVFNIIKELELSEIERQKLTAYFEKVLAESKYFFLDNVTVTDTSGINIYQLEIFNNHAQNYYILKFCDSNFNCRITQKIKNEVSETQFKEIMTFYAANWFKDTAGEFRDPELTALYAKIRSYNEDKRVRDLTKPLEDSILGLVNQLENLATSYSGAIKSKQSVPVYTIEDELSDMENLFESLGLKFLIDYEGRYKKRKDNRFILNYSTMRFFNNKAKDIVIVGTLEDSEGKQSEQVLFNNDFGIPLRALNNKEEFVNISSEREGDTHKELFINYDDVFEYYPSKSTFNYSPRDKEYLIKPGDTVKLEQRKLMDYFTAVIFSDFLGLNRENSNALLQAEARMKIPLNTRNIINQTMFHSINVDFNATLFNGFDDTSRFITPLEITPGEESQSISAVTVNIFDFIKYQNLNTGISVNVLNSELRDYSTEFNLAVGGRYYRSGLKYIFKNEGLDNEIDYQLNALTPEISMNFELRPHLNFGADLDLAYNWLHSRGSTGDIDVLYSSQRERDKGVVRMQLNLYSKLNPDVSNSGVYGRIGGYFHPGSKDFYPQILVGYATNLSSFVNTFKGD